MARRIGDFKKKKGGKYNIDDKLKIPKKIHMRLKKINFVTNIFLFCATKTYIIAQKVDINPFQK